MTREPTISVKGVGNVSVPPDMTVISFSVNARSWEYTESVEDLNHRVGVLRDRLKNEKIDPKTLKTTRFGVNADYRYEDSERVFNGWHAVHGLRLELSIDQEELNRALKAIMTDDAEAEYNIRFEVRDKEALREAVLADATRTAQRNAEAMAAAANCHLGKVLNIEYGWSEIRYGSIDYDMALEDNAPRMMAAEIEPEDVDAHDSVTVVWELLSS